MGRSACPACGATVDVGFDIETGKPVVIEVNTDAASDAPRYRVANVGPPLQLERVPDGAPGDYHTVHSFDCPQGNAGRTF